MQLVGEQPRYWRNLGQVRSAAPRPMAEVPGELLLADPDVQFMDATGDGKPDCNLCVPLISSDRYLAATVLSDR